MGDFSAQRHAPNSLRDDAQYNTSPVQSGSCQPILARKRRRQAVVSGGRS
ncbi:MAG TPA: hypothetical protein VK457_23290 [Chloroflexota bacterium]|nr:hypothetical protein [Chloroflexota bacterium]